MVQIEGIVAVMQDLVAFLLTQLCEQTYKLYLNLYYNSEINLSDILVKSNHFFKLSNKQPNLPILEEHCNNKTSSF